MTISIKPANPIAPKVYELTPDSGSSATATFPGVATSCQIFNNTSVAVYVMFNLDADAILLLDAHASFRFGAGDAHLTSVTVLNTYAGGSAGVRADVAIVAGVIGG